MAARLDLSPPSGVSDPLGWQVHDIWDSVAGHVAAPCAIGKILRCDEPPGRLAVGGLVVWHKEG